MTDRIFRDVDGTLEFVGDFEGLYRDDADPWGQSGQDAATARYYEFSRHRLGGFLAMHAPAFRYYAGDIRNPDALTPQFVGKFDAVILSHVLWYILEGIEKAITNAARLTRPGGLVIVSQAFLREQRYGREVIDGFAGAVAFMSKFPGLDMVEAHYEGSGALAFNDGLLALRKAPDAQ